MSHKAVRLDEIPIVDDGRTPMRPVRHYLGIQAFGLNALVARGAGESAVNDHDEADSGDEELYVVMSGHAVFTIDGEEVDAPKGTLVFVQPTARRIAVAKEEGTTILAVGAEPGEAYRPSGWEVGSAAMQAFYAGDYESAIRELAPLAEQHPEYPGLTYNLACAENLAGRTEDALEHLRRAIELDGKFGPFAKGDSDFDSIRNDARFESVVAGEADARGESA